MPLFVTPTPLLPNILKSALPLVSDAADPPPLSVVIVTAVISPLLLTTVSLTTLPLESKPRNLSLSTVPSAMFSK